MTLYLPIFLLFRKSLGVISIEIADNIFIENYLCGLLLF